jgi:hypothetical protein
MHDMSEAKQVPLIERLRSVPSDARVIYEHNTYESESIPVGALCNEAAHVLDNTATYGELNLFAGLLRECLYPLEVSAALIESDAEEETGLITAIKIALGHYDHSRIHRQAPETERGSNLIAAAPELLEALREALGALHPSNIRAIETARAAIRKAQGEQQ